MEDSVSLALMDYISTRDENRTPRKFSDVLLAGLAPDGGLYLPAEYPQLNTETLAAWRDLLNTEGYAALAAAVLELFIDDIPPADIRAICQRAYSTPTFSTPEIVPLSTLTEQLRIGHLSEGPTAAFKDMAMQLLGELFEYELNRRDARLNILGATSGDTGSAAEYAMRGRHNIRVFMLTPAGRMSPFQQAQMFGLNDPHIFNIALDGVFDDCQDVVKAISNDADFKQKHAIGAVNSINWARLLAQVVYYVALWIRATEASGDNTTKISFSVPTGNFGDICAGHIARQMGLPIDKLIVATNENDVLDEFFRTGHYLPRSSADTFETSSPSMDISRASNFERFIYDLLGQDPTQVAQLFGTDVPNGGFSLADNPVFPETVSRYGFLSATSTHADRLATIRRYFDEHQVLLDPHTADGVHAAEIWGDEIETPIVCLETALPVKFAETIKEATGQEPPVPARFAAIMKAGRYVTDLPNDADTVKQFIAGKVEQD